MGKEKLTDLIFKHRSITSEQARSHSESKIQTYKKKHQILMSEYELLAKQKNIETNKLIQKFNLEPVIDQLSEFYSNQGLIVAPLETPGVIKKDFSRNFGYIPEIINEINYLKKNGAWFAVRANKELNALANFDYRRILFSHTLLGGLQVEGQHTQLSGLNKFNVMDAVAKIISQNDDCFRIESDPYPFNDGGGY